MSKKTTTPTPTSRICRALKCRTTEILQTKTTTIPITEIRPIKEIRNSSIELKFIWVGVAIKENAKLFN